MRACLPARNASTPSRYPTRTASGSSLAWVCPITTLSSTAIGLLLFVCSSSGGDLRRGGDPSGGAGYRSGGTADAQAGLLATTTMQPRNGIGLAFGLGPLEH